MSGILFLGFLIGMRHALEADHVAAVAVLATRAKTVRQAVPLGVMWGVGHTLTLFAFGAVIVVLNANLPENVTHVLEAVVGVMLVGLGVDVIFRVIKKRIHFHIHAHKNEKQHIHAHSHEGEKEHVPSQHSHEHFKGLSFRALIVGMMHGMAGSAALVLLTMQSVEPIATRIIYIVLFGIGSMVGMGLLSIVIAVPLRYAADSMTWAYNGMSVVLGLFSTGLGLLTIYHSGMFA
ncbi:MAG: urease accessory protein [Rhodospirillales bacterium]|nr:urease accessory protein [Rhodospirillales bacterium]